MPESSFASARYLAINATITTIFRAIGVASGIALDAVILGLYGLSHQTDAYFAALAIPSLITGTVEAQGPKVLVPFFAQAFEQNGREETWCQLRNVMATAGVLFVIVSALLTAAAWLLMPMQVPGLNSDTVRLAIELQMALAWLVLIQGLSAIVASVLYADHHYIATASSRTTTNLVAILVVWYLHSQLGVQALALGFIVGSGAQLVCLICVAISRGLWFGPTQLRDPKTYRILKLCTYPLLGQAVSESRTFLENYLGSLIGAGALSAVRYANRVIGSVAGVLVDGLVTTSLPILSFHAANQKFFEMKEALLKAFRFMSLLAVPIGLWLAFAGESLIAVAFERGQFTSADSARIGMLLGLLAPYVLSSRIVGVAELAFYATMDTRTPLWATAAFLVSYTLLCFVLLPSVGVYAFAVATSIGAILTAILMVKLVEWRFGALPWRDSKDFTRRLVLTTLISTAGFAFGAAVNVNILTGSQLTNLARLLIVSGSGWGAFVAAAVVVGLIDWQVLRSIARPNAATSVADVAVDETI